MYSARPSGAPSPVEAGVLVEKLTGSKAKHQLWIALEDKLNPKGKVPSDPKYHLYVTLASDVTAIGIAIDGTVSRYNVTLTSSYVLKDRITGEPVTSGNLRHVGSYNNRTNEYFSTYVSSEDALERGVSALSETYRQRLAPFLNGQRPPARVEADAQAGSP
ncbi:MAG: hypothetical protein AB7L92_02465 [Alphaproteobacteria bacterium]